MRLSIRVILPAILISCGLVTDAQNVDGFLALRGASTRGPANWIEGGWGRVSGGGDELKDAGTATETELRLSTEAGPSRLRFHVSGVARYEERALSNTTLGLTELYLESRVLERDTSRLRVRAGLFFLPTSRENIADQWSSPYTIDWSAWNSWVAEEVRPISVETEYRWAAGPLQLTGAASVFGGNDSMGSLLAWRGWAIGHRVSSVGEVLPLPPLETLSTFFAGQRKDGTKPVGRDLDGRAGWSARIRAEAADRVAVQWLHLDNRGDRELHRGEYAWATRFDHLFLEVSPSGSFTIASEIATGETGMGIPGGARVQMDFLSAYGLVSYAYRSARMSARYDHFQTTDRDGTAAEINTEDGDSLTAALGWRVSDHFGGTLQYIHLEVERAGLERQISHGFSAEVRYQF